MTPSVTQLVAEGSMARVTPVTKRIVVRAMKTVRVEHLEGRDQPVTAGTAAGASVLAMMQKGVKQATDEFNYQYVRKRIHHLKI